MRLACGRSTCCEKMAQLAARPVARTSRFGGLARKRHVSTLERGAQVARLCATGFAFATTIGCVVALEMQFDLRSSQYHTARPRCNTLHWVKVGYYWRRVVTLRLPASLSVPECSMERDVADVEGELGGRGEGLSFHLLQDASAIIAGAGGQRPHQNGTWSRKHR